MSCDRVDALEMLDFPMDSETLVLAALAPPRPQRSPLRDQVRQGPNPAVFPDRQGKVKSSGWGGLLHS